MTACRRRAAGAEAMTSQARNAEAASRPAARSLLAIARRAVGPFTGGGRLPFVEPRALVAFPRSDAGPEGERAEQGHHHGDAGSGEEDVQDVGGRWGDEDRQE